MSYLCNILSYTHNTNIIGLNLASRNQLIYLLYKLLLEQLKNLLLYPKYIVIEIFNFYYNLSYFYPTPYFSVRIQI